MGIKLTRIYDEFNVMNETHFEGLGWLTKKELQESLKDLSIEQRKDKFKSVTTYRIKYYDIAENGWLMYEGFEDFSIERYETFKKEKNKRGNGQYDWDLRTYKQGKGHRLVTDNITFGNFKKRYAITGNKKIIIKFVEFMEKNFIEKGYKINIWKI